MTVFVVQKPKPGPQGNTYDVSPALEYGNIRFIFDAYDNPSASPEESFEKALDVLTGFDPKTDYIVWSGGDPYALFIVGFIMRQLDYPLRYLRFERYRKKPDEGNVPRGQPGYYLPVDISPRMYEL